MLAIIATNICTGCHDTIEAEVSETCGYCKPKEPPMQPADVKNMTIRELTTVVIKSALAVTLPVLIFSALAGVAAGVAVVAFQFTTSIF